MPVETVNELIESLRGERATSPRLIWYGPDSERVELSGRVLDNWVAKTSNLLVDELDAEAGTAILLDLPPHWRSLSWALAAWQIGARLQLVNSGNSAGGAAGSESRDAAAGSDIIVTTDPDRWAEAEAAAPQQYVVAVALGALQLSWDGPLPAGALDYAGEIRSHGDVYLGSSAPAGADTALTFDGASVQYGELLHDYAAEATPQDPALSEEHQVHGQVVLVPAELSLHEVLQQALSAWVDGGSIVLVHPDVDVTDALLAGEQVTRRLRAGEGG